MKYTCPTCGKQYDVNYCDECKKIIELPTDNADNNTIQVWGTIILILGLIGIFISITLALQKNFVWVYLISFGAFLFVFGLLLLGISAVVDRLNTIIKLMKESKPNKD